MPRFWSYRQAGTELWHECGDLAVRFDSLNGLGSLRKARDRALGQGHAKRPHLSEQAVGYVATENARPDNDCRTDQSGPKRQCADTAISPHLRGMATRKAHHRTSIEKISGEKCPDNGPCGYSKDARRSF